MREAEVTQSLLPAGPVMLGGGQSWGKRESGVSVITPLQLHTAAGTDILGWPLWTLLSKAHMCPWREEGMQSSEPHPRQGLPMQNGVDPHHLGHEDRRNGKDHWTEWPIGSIPTLKICDSAVVIPTPAPMEILSNVTATYWKWTRKSILLPPARSWSWKWRAMWKPRTIDLRG